MIAAEGYEQSQRLRGEGEAEAIRIYARRSGGSGILRLLAPPEAYAKALKQGDTVVVPADADFFNYLTRGGMPRSAIAWLPVVLRSWPGLVSFGTVKQLSASTQVGSLYSSSARTWRRHKVSPGSRRVEQTIR